MSADWIHCNACITLPSQTVQFAFSSCGHIICKKCLSKIAGSPAPCPYCKKAAHFVEINRSLKAEMQMLFRNPRDLASEYMKNLSTVLDFQHGHRSRLTRAQHEQQKKAMKFVNAAQGEVKKRMEAEKKALSENKEIRSELEKTKLQMQKLEALLATRELELQRIRMSNTPYRSPGPPPPPHYQRSDSGLGDTPTPHSSMSFIDAMTSTPLHQSPSRSHGSSGRRRSRDRLKEMFQSSNGTVPSPITCVEQLATPNLLGMKQRRSTSENNRRSSNFVFDNDRMEIGGGF